MLKGYSLEKQYFSFQFDNLTYYKDFCLVCACANIIHIKTLHFEVIHYTQKMGEITFEHFIMTPPSSSIMIEERL